VLESLQGLHLQKKDGVEKLYYKLRPEINLQLSTKCETCLFFPYLFPFKAAQLTHVVKLWKSHALSKLNLATITSANAQLRMWRIC
jgi:hypothetical protein